MAQVALPTPRTWTAGSDLATAAYLNGVRDGLLHSQQPPRFMAHQSIAQTIADQNWTRVSMDTLDISDGYYTGGGGWSSGSPTVYTCQMSGRYLCEASVSIQSGLSFTINLAASFYYTPPGGSPTQLTVGTVSGQWNHPASTPVLNLTRPIYMDAGGQLGIAIWQTYSTPQALSTSVTGNGPSFLACTWMATT